MKKLIIILLCAAALGSGGYYTYTQYVNPTPEKLWKMLESDLREGMKELVDTSFDALLIAEGDTLSQTSSFEVVVPIKELPEEVTADVDKVTLSLTAESKISPHQGTPATEILAQLDITVDAPGTQLQGSGKLHLILTDKQIYVAIEELSLPMNLNEFIPEGLLSTWYAFEVPETEEAPTADTLELFLADKNNAMRTVLKQAVDDFHVTKQPITHAVLEDGWYQYELSVDYPTIVQSVKDVLVALEVPQEAIDEMFIEKLPDNPKSPFLITVNPRYRFNQQVKASYSDDMAQTECQSGKFDSDMMTLQCKTVTAEGEDTVLIDFQEVEKNSVTGSIQAFEGEKNIFSFFVDRLEVDDALQDSDFDGHLELAIEDFDYVDTITFASQKRTSRTQNNPIQIPQQTEDEDAFSQQLMMMFFGASAGMEDIMNELSTEETPATENTDRPSVRPRISPSAN